MSLNLVLANAYSGINASQAALRVTSNNVANANTEGYARQEVGLTPQIAGGIGSGVSIEEVVRVVDEFLEASEADAISAAEQSSVVREFHDRVQALLGRPDADSSLTSRLDQVMASISTATLDPSDALRRQSLISDLESFLTEVRRLSTDVQALRVDASNQMAEQVALMNQQLEQIERLNPLIAQAELGQGDTGPLKDQRDRAIRELSEIIDIRVSKTGTGAVQIATTDGVTLLDDRRRLVSYSSPGAGDSFTEFDRITIQRLDPITGVPETSTRDIDDSLGGGRLQGLLDVRDSELPAIADSLGELAQVFSDQINALHNTNASVPAPNLLSGRATALQGTDLARLTGIADFAVVDSSGTLLSTATIDFDALGPAATMTDVVNAINAGMAGFATASLASDGSLSIAATNLNNGVVIAGDPANPAARAGRGFSHFFGLNDLISTGQPTHFETGFNGTDAHGYSAGQTMDFEIRDQSGRILRTETVTITGTTFDDIVTSLNDPLGLGGYFNFSLDGNGSLQAQSLPGFGEITLLSRNDTTARAGSDVPFTELFGLRRGTQAAAAADISVNSVVTENPEFLALGKFDRSVPVGDRALTVGDGRGAAELRDLQLSPMDFDAAGTLQPLETTLNQYAAYVVGNAAIMAETATSREEDNRALQITISQRRQDVSGVNIDEELAEMVVFQNAYNASARLITTVRQMFEELLNVV
ncbi:MAG: flagellar hook-associated protein FlgK [Pseudomonadota bacterium]